MGVMRGCIQSGVCIYYDIHVYRRIKDVSVIFVWLR